MFWNNRTDKQDTENQAERIQEGFEKKIWGECVCRDSTKYFFEKYIQKQNTSLSNSYASNI